MEEKKEKKKIQITKRDYEILCLIHKFRFCLGRHIKVLANFPSVRVTDRRLKLLVENGFLTRKKYMYGVPYLYTLTHKGKIFIGANKRVDKLRIDRVTHDVTVLETVIFYVKKNGLSLNEIISEKELHIKSGFGIRQHFPDFIALINNEKHAIEIEINSKSKARLEQNIELNFKNYDKQIWFTDNKKVWSMIEELKEKTPNLYLASLEGVRAYARTYE